MKFERIEQLNSTGSGRLGVTILHLHITILFLFNDNDSSPTPAKKKSGRMRVLSDPDGRIIRIVSFFFVPRWPLEGVGYPIDS